MRIVSPMDCRASRNDRLVPSMYTVYTVPVYSSVSALYSYLSSASWPMARCLRLLSSRLIVSDVPCSSLLLVALNELPTVLGKGVHCALCRLFRHQHVISVPTALLVNVPYLQNRFEALPCRHREDGNPGGLQGQSEVAHHPRDPCERTHWYRKSFREGRRSLPKSMVPAILMQRQAASVSSTLEHSKTIDTSSLVRVREMKRPSAVTGSVNMRMNGSGIGSSGLSWTTLNGRSSILRRKEG